MVDVIGRAKVIIEGTVDTGSIAKSGGKIGDVLKKGALVGGAALTTLAAVGVETYLAFEEAEAQSKKLANVLDNMGKAKAITAVEDLADELMRLTGVDDEVIKGGQTILATFDAVAESAGTVGGTFDRATRTAVDMASVFGSVESASRVLGKALSDPEKAAALLRRSNVILNEEQQTLIDRFLAAGDAAGAQDVILQALEDRYAGTAEASARESTKIATAFGELKENVGLLVADMVTSLSGEGKGKKKSLSGSIYEVSDAVKELSESASWKKLQGQLRTTSNIIGSIVGPVEKVFKAFDKLEKKAPILADVLGTLVKPYGIIKFAVDGLVDSLQDLWELFDRGAPNFSSSGRDLTVEDLLGRAGGGRAPSGLILAGENGPELIEMGSQGGYVHNNSETRNILSNTGGDTINNYWQFFGPESLSQARQQEDWSRSYGTRFGSATRAVTA